MINLNMPLKKTNLDPSIISILEKAEIFTIKDLIDNPCIISDLNTFKFILLKKWMHDHKL